jgi:hypothetical protein
MHEIGLIAKTMLFHFGTPLGTIITSLIHLGIFFGLWSTWTMLWLKGYQKDDWGIVYVLACLFLFALVTGETMSLINDSALLYGSPTLLDFFGKEGEITLGVVITIFSACIIIKLFPELAPGYVKEKVSPPWAEEKE